MHTHGTSSDVEMTAGQIKQLGAILLKQIPTTLPKWQAQYLINHPGFVKEVLGDLEKPYRRLWKTVFVGYLKKQDFQDSPFINIEAGSVVEDMLRKVTFSKRHIPVHLALATTRAITGKENANLKEMYAGIKAFGGLLCEGEIGPYLREAYRSQPFGEEVFVAMEPMEGERGFSRIFVLESDKYGYDGLKLRHAYVSWEDRTFGPDRLWVFGLPLVLEKDWMSR